MIKPSLQAWEIFFKSNLLPSVATCETVLHSNSLILLLLKKINCQINYSPIIQSFQVFPHLKSCLFLVGTPEYSKDLSNLINEVLKSKHVFGQQIFGCIKAILDWHSNMNFLGGSLFPLSYFYSFSLDFIHIYLLIE